MTSASSLIVCFVTHSKQLKYAVMRGDRVTLWEISRDYLALLLNERERDELQDAAELRFR